VETFVILTFASRTGTFDILGGDAGLFTVVYDPTDVTLAAQ
jgi:hypothetical protein